MISAKEAAAHLGISKTRLCLLLRQGRIKGATKQGRVWMIPVEDGKLPISNKRKGPRGRWTVVKKLEKKRIHVNGQRIKSNNKKAENERKPVISVKVGNDKKNIYTNDVRLLGYSRVVYQPEDPMNCGAKVWVETYANVFIPEGFDIKDKSPDNKKQAFYL